MDTSITEIKAGSPCHRSQQSTNALDRDFLDPLTNRRSFGRLFAQSVVFHKSFRDCATSPSFGIPHDTAEVWITIGR